MPLTNTTEEQKLRDFESLVQEHQIGLRVFVRALGVEEGWVDDVAQEAFVIAYRRLDTFETGTDFGRWLRGIARHLVANERRKKARHSRLLPLVLADMLLDSVSDDTREPDSSSRLLGAMHECVKQLPSRSRDLLERRYAGGETAATLARQLRLNADSVRQNLLRIRVAVKQCIEQRVGASKP